eukprot:1191375-Prorocentrum_minimum.AAC.1
MLTTTLSNCQSHPDPFPSCRTRTCEFTGTRMNSPSARRNSPAARRHCRGRWGSAPRRCDMIVTPRCTIVALATHLSDVAEVVGTLHLDGVT